MIGYKSDKGTNGIYYNEYTGEIGLLKDIDFFRRLLFRYKPKFFAGDKIQIAIGEILSTTNKIKYLDLLHNNLLNNIKVKSKDLSTYNEFKNVSDLRKSIINNECECEEELSKELIDLIDKLIEVDNEIFSLLLKKGRVKTYIETVIAIDRGAIYFNRGRGK